ncbi:alpha-N-methyltransferase NTM1 [Aspergillus californicus]
MSAGSPESNSPESGETPPDANINHAASLEYWNGVPATPGAMLAVLGDYPWYTRIDLRGSKTFLGKVRRLVPGCTRDEKLKRAADCGAGVGRVTEGFLRFACDVVDAVEPVEKFTDVIKERKLKDGVTGIGDIYVMGIEAWVPDKQYDLIWTQFCVGHVTDVQLVEYFNRCRDALTETGILVVKENMSTDRAGKDMYDDEDSSVTRTDEKFRALFKDAGLTVVASELQLGFPKDFKLLPVRFYALRPKS